MTQFRFVWSEKSRWIVFCERATIQEIEESEVFDFCVSVLLLRSASKNTNCRKDPISDKNDMSRMFEKILASQRPTPQGRPFLCELHSMKVGMSICGSVLFRGHPCLRAPATMLESWRRTSRSRGRNIALCLLDHYVYSLFTEELFRLKKGWASVVSLKFAFRTDYSSCLTVMSSSCHVCTVVGGQLEVNEQNWQPCIVP